jgi:hypothetical protein
MFRSTTIHLLASPVVVCDWARLAAARAANSRSELEGPFDTQRERLTQARTIWNAGESVVAALDLSVTNEPTVGKWNERQLDAKRFGLPDMDEECAPHALWFPFSRTQTSRPVRPLRFSSPRYSHR